MSASTGDLERRAEDLRQRLLRDGLISLVAKYDGYADSGWIEEINCYGESAGRKYSLSSDLFQAVENLFIDVLEERHAGWEDNYGARGEFLWDLRTNALTHTHHARFEDYHTTEHEGWPTLAAETDAESSELEPAQTTEEGR
ncbi:MAG: hypothetical protein KatS3mg082_2623 [Nitrospiraceae bacterium]|nr:MAG: hypothetical protein KatS3mg082_2623 [Nitrospiraceae bacterium]